MFNIFGAKKEQELSYKDGQIVDKKVSDKMGHKNEKDLPKWAQKGAIVPDHVKQLRAEKIELPFPNANKKWVVLVRNVLTKEECNDLIKLSETHGYEDALVNIGYGRQQMIESFRNCKRVMIDSWSMIDTLWTRLSPFIPTYLETRRKISFNERLRFLRYHKGQYFHPHFDGCYRRKNGEQSKITLLLYLNTGFVGGNTNFLDLNSNKYHAPKIEPGMVIMFQHDVYHEGALLVDGTKYIVRTDVMYSKKKFSKKDMENDKENVDIRYKKYDVNIAFNDESVPVNDNDYDQKTDDDEDGQDKDVDYIDKIMSQTQLETKLENEKRQKKESDSEHYIGQSDSTD